MGRIAPLAEHGDDSVDPIGALTDESEPVPMSLDRDASDRTFDRHLAYLGLLDDAAPLFHDGAAVPGAGVLLALPCVIESGLFSISRKLYGEIGRAFYGLRTTLMTLVLMALLRIKRPEQLKERDPAAFGRMLGLDRAPEVKTLRRQLTRLAAHHCAEQLGTELARRAPISAVTSWVSCTLTAMCAPIRRTNHLIERLCATPPSGHACHHRLLDQ